MRALSRTPVVLHPISLPEIFRYILEHSTAPSRFIVCSSREQFTSQLQRLVDPDTVEEAEERTAPDEATTREDPISFLHLTLDCLSRSRHVKISFCPSIEALHAYLSVYSTKMETPGSAPEETGRQPILVLLNVLSLHTDSITSFSAQGLSRLFAAAVEAAERSMQELVIAECQPPITQLDLSEQTQTISVDAQDHPVDGDTHGTVVEEDTGMTDEELLIRGDASVHDPRETAKDPWATQVPILSMSIRRLGLGEGSLGGRSVTVRSVAARWCDFKTIAEHETDFSNVG